MRRPDVERRISIATPIVAWAVTIGAKMRWLVELNGTVFSFIMAQRVYTFH
jgi:hypothetical protein